MRFFAEAHYKFIESRRKAYVFSGIVLLVGIAAMVFNVTSLGTWQNYGVVFTGGSLSNRTCTSEPPVKSTP